ncbi:PAS domain-containing protein [Pseudarthrobacter sp. Fe7]|nr:PAS domain-containing protein [Pseudarthrobacter sp. Fe7]
MSPGSVVQRHRVRHRFSTLTAQILLASLSLLLFTVALGGFLFSMISNQTLDQQYQLRALAIATTTAQMSEVRSALAAGDAGHVIDGIAHRIMAAAQPDYVVVSDRDGTRFSHPDPGLIGRRLEEPVAVLDGQTHVGFDPGSLGRSANAKAPIFGADGSVIGQVSVGIEDTQVLSNQMQNIWLITGFSALVLALGVAGSLLLSRRIKRVTFDLEPAEIASLLQEREALLHGIREAVVGLDDDGKVTVINEEARRLLHLEGEALGKPIADLLPHGRLRDLLAGRLPGADQVALTDDALLVVNRMPVSTAGRSIGSVVTLRDRTEIEGLVRDLHSIQGLMEAMRALEHEYANRLHIVDGLLEMGDLAHAKRYVSQVSAMSRSLGERLRATIAPPELAALLLAKVAVAAEQDVQMEVTADSRLEHPEVDHAEPANHSGEPPGQCGGRARQYAAPARRHGTVRRRRRCLHRGPGQRARRPGGQDRPGDGGWLLHQGPTAGNAPRDRAGTGKPDCAQGGWDAGRVPRARR